MALSSLPFPCLLLVVLLMPLTPGSADGDSCSSSGSFPCNGQDYPTYMCSPPVTESTSAFLTLNNFSDGGDGGGPSKCDGKYHDNGERIVALSTGWYDNNSRCGKMIQITADNGNTAEAMVVDECDSMLGCDAEHAGQPPCGNNIVDGSKAVWDALGLDQNQGKVPVTWSMA